MPFAPDAGAEYGIFDWGKNLVHCSRHANSSAAQERQLFLKGKVTTLVWDHFLFIGEDKLIDRIAKALPD